MSEPDDSQPMDDDRVLGQLLRRIFTQGCFGPHGHAAFSDGTLTVDLTIGPTDEEEPVVVRAMERAEAEAEAQWVRFRAERASRTSPADSP